ncbi:hypothetical protein MKX03_025372 [Papaver bracteatum]|nr:hypothetical protein MKX03_025372 [Papaver bracteatum]
MNSLVSLKGLGEDYCPRKRYDVNPAPKEIFIKQRRKDDGNIDVNPSLPKTRCLGKQVVSPIRAILMTVGLEASHSSKAADRNVGDSRKRKERLLKRKSHCSDRIANSSRQLYSSDENSPLGHRSRGSLFVRYTHFVTFRFLCLTFSFTYCPCCLCLIFKGESGVGGTQKIVADVEISSDHDGNIGETCRKVGATLHLKLANKQYTDGSDMSDQESEKAGSEPDRLYGQGVGQPRERDRGSSLMPPLGPSERGQLDRPLPEYTAPQLCPPNFLMVAGFPVLPEYKDLYTQVIASKGHIASDVKVKSILPALSTMVTELLETIQRMSKLSGHDVTNDLQRWRAAVDTASAMDFHVSWLDDQFRLLESQLHDVEEQKVTKRSLEAEVRGCEKRMSLLRSKVDESRRAYKAAKVDKASFEANNHAAIALSCSALGSCLATPC